MCSGANFCGPKWKLYSHFGRFEIAPRHRVKPCSLIVACSPMDCKGQFPKMGPMFCRGKTYVFPLFAPLHSTNKQNKHSPNGLMLKPINNRHTPPTYDRRGCPCVFPLHPSYTPNDTLYIALALTSDRRGSLCLHPCCLRPQRHSLCSPSCCLRPQRLSLVLCLRPQRLPLQCPL